jgi:transposase
MEIITGVERRRHWRLDDKLRIVAEAERPGARFVDVARRHEVSRSLLWSWRDQARRGVLSPDPTPVFVPLQVTVDRSEAEREPMAATTPARPSTSLRPEGDAGASRIEIALPDGTVVRVSEGIGSAALRRVLAALRA